MLALTVTSCATEPSLPMAAKAREGLERAQQSTVNLRLSCEPLDAEIVADGIEQGTCEDYAGASAGLALGSGMHRIEVLKEGYRPYVTYYEPSGARAALTIRLVRIENSEGAHDAP